MMGSAAADSAKRPVAEDRLPDRDRLINILMQDKEVRREQAERYAEKTSVRLVRAEEVLAELRDRIDQLPHTDTDRADAVREADALSEQIEAELRPAAITANVRHHEARVAHREELAITKALVRDMSEYTVSAFTRSLDRAVADGLVLSIGSDHVQTALDNRFDRRQIAALIRVLTEEARFAQQSAKRATDQNNGQENGLANTPPDHHILPTSETQ
ncbi:MAG: hypothetical protein WEB93_02395 [Sphingomonadales bacterium]